MGVYVHAESIFVVEGVAVAVDGEFTEPTAGDNSRESQGSLFVALPRTRR